MLHLDQMEALYYKLQLQLYDVQAEVLQCEELLLTAQLQSLRRQMTGPTLAPARRQPQRARPLTSLSLMIPEHQDEVVYYDAYESPDAMRGEEEPPSPPSPLRDEELSTLQLRTRQLEARRGRITAKRVYLKNKKVRPEGRASRPPAPGPAPGPRPLPSPTGNLHHQPQPEDTAAPGRPRRRRWRRGLSGDDATGGGGRRRGQEERQRGPGEAEDPGEAAQPQTGEAHTPPPHTPPPPTATGPDLLPLTPPPALPGSGDPEVQPTAPESASEPEERRPAAQHPGGRRADRLHLGPPGALRSSSSSSRVRRLSAGVPARHPAPAAGRLGALPLAASALGAALHFDCPSASSPSPSSSAASPSSPHVAASLRGRPGPEGFPRDGNLLPAPGSVLPSVLRQQPAADGEEQAEEDRLPGLIAVEER